MRPAERHLSVSSARAGALFASACQCSDEPAARQVQQAITATVRMVGGRGCAVRVAQEFGDHPDTAGRGCTGPATSRARFFAGSAVSSARDRALAACAPAQVAGPLEGWLRVASRELAIKDWIHTFELEYF